MLMSNRYIFLYKKISYLRKRQSYEAFMIAIILRLCMYLLLCLKCLLHYDLDHIQCHCFKSHCYTCTHIFSQPYLLNLVKTFSFDNG